LKALYFIIISAVFYWTLKLSFSRKKTIQEVPNKYFGWASFVVFFALLLGTPKWGNNIPGSLFERREYEGTYLVIVYEGTQREVSEEALAHIESGVEVHSGYGDEDDQFYSNRTYRLRSLAFWNGKIITFDEGDDEELELNKTVNVTKYNRNDDAMKTWGVKLLDIPSHD